MKVLLANQTLLLSLLTEHVALASATTATTAKTLAGNILTFKINATDVSINALVCQAQSGPGIIADSGATSPKVIAAVQCPGQVIFAVDTILVASAYQSALVTVSPPSTAPTPAVTPWHLSRALLQPLAWLPLLD